MARTCACSCCTSRQVEPEVLTEELPLVARAIAGVGMAMERRGWAGGGLLMEETVKLSKLTSGWVAGVEELGTEISQEKVIWSISLQRDSVAEMGILRDASHSIDSVMAWAEDVKEA